MAAPTATAAFSKSVYTPGETMVLTIDHADTDRATITVAGTVTDSSGNTGPFSATALIDEGTVAVTDGGGKTWAVQSATRNRTVLTATA